MFLAREAFRGFEEKFGKKGPIAAAKIVPDEKALLAYYDYLAEHWRHL
jgi:putative transposase